MYQDPFQEDTRFEDDKLPIIKGVGTEKLSQPSSRLRERAEADLQLLVRRSPLTLNISPAMHGEALKLSPSCVICVAHRHCFQLTDRNGSKRCNRGSGTRTKECNLCLIGALPQAPRFFAFGQDSWVNRSDAPAESLPKRALRLRSLRA